MNGTETEMKLEWRNEMRIEPEPDGCMAAHVTHMLTLSTAHIDRPTADMLDEEGEANRFPALSVYPKSAGEDYGWFIYIGPGWRDAETPEDLKACLAACDAAGCGMLCLDADGPVVPDLSVYDW